MKRNHSKIIFIDTSTFSETYNNNFIFNYGRKEKITSLAFSPCLFLEYIGFSGNYLKLYLDELIEQISCDSLTKSPLSISDIYLQIYHKFRSLLDIKSDELTARIEERLKSKTALIAASQNEITQLFKINFQKCLGHANLFGAIKDYLSFNGALGWSVICDEQQSSAEDQLFRMEQIFAFASFLAQKQACEKIEINPLRILINNTNFLKQIYENKEDVTNFQGIKNVFRMLKKYNGQLSPYFFSSESQMGDLDVLWYSYTGYHWNREVCSVIACTHDRANILDLMRWRECFIYALNMMSSVRYTPGGKIVVFRKDEPIPQEYPTSKAKL